MAGDRFILSDLSACWCDKRGRIRPMRVLLARDDPDAYRTVRMTVPRSFPASLVAARLDELGEMIRR